MANNYYSFDNLEDINWQKIKNDCPMAFDKYMDFEDLESFMVALNCTIDVNYHLNEKEDEGYWETRAECKERAIMVIGIHTFGETKSKSVEILFEIIEKQMINDGYKRN